MELVGEFSRLSACHVSMKTCIWFLEFPYTRKKKKKSQTRWQVLEIPALLRQRQLDLWVLLGSQPKWISKPQTNLICKTQNRKQLKNNTSYSLLASPSICTCLHAYLSTHESYTQIQKENMIYLLNKSDLLSDKHILQLTTFTLNQY